MAAFANTPWERCINAIEQCPHSGGSDEPSAICRERMILCLRLLNAVGLNGMQPFGVTREPCGGLITTFDVPPGDSNNFLELTVYNSGECELAIWENNRVTEICTVCK